MSLWEDMMETCQLQELRRTDDGEGGYSRSWSPASEFEAAVVHDKTTQDRVAEKQGAVTTWTVTTRAELAFHDVFKRQSDGKAFRVTSEAADGRTPSAASFQFNQCTAEEYDMEVPE